MTRKGFLLTMAVCVLLTGSAMADSVQVKYLNVSPYRTARIYLGNQYKGHVYAGVYNLGLNPAAGTYSGPEADALVASASPDYVLNAFCSDIHQNVPSKSGWTTYDIFRPEDAPVGGPNLPGGMGVDKAWDLRRLFHQHQDAWTGGTSTQNRNAAAAFQMAVWEIVFETGAYGVGSGHFRTNSTASWVPLADTWLQQLGTDQPEVDLRVLVNEAKQDYAITIPGVGTHDGPSTPEPLTILAVCLGAGSVGTYIRRRMRSKTA